MEVIFCILSILSVIFTLLTITQKNAVYSLLYLIISFFSISGIYFLFGAFFLGALEIIIYAGAIIVLFVFVIMMLNLGNKNYMQEEQDLRLFISVQAIMLLCTFLFLMGYVLFPLNAYKINHFFVASKVIGLNLFGPYMLLVELSSMLLLSALVIVFHIGTEKK